MKQKVIWSLCAYFSICLLYAFFSFSLTDPNLVLTTWPSYWQFQQWMWQTFFMNHQLLTQSYVAVILGFFLIYFWVFRSIKNVTFSLSWLNAFKLFGLFLFMTSPLLLSYNALSHDVFNYIFNAKMVAIYHANPHQQVALDFAADTWTRFMHNTHTTAPYGYGWTIISLFPFVLGVGKFLPTWLLFRAWSVVGILLSYVSILLIFKLEGRKQLPLQALAAVFLNPLFVIELISNSHNDMWMMAPALCAFALVIKKQPKFLFYASISFFLLIFSISIKFATILLFPVWLILIASYFNQNRYFIKLKSWWPELSVFLLFLPLLSDRSQQFNPWYLTWLLIWWPFLKWRGMKIALIVLSLSSLVRYVPWLWNGEFTDQVILQQKLITWVPFVICGAILLITTIQKKKKAI